MNSKIRFSRILYDREKGLSRGVALISFETDKLNKEILRRGVINIEGRNVAVHKAEMNDIRTTGSQ